MSRTNERFETFAAIMIALVTVVGATVAWMATMTESAASDANDRGILDTITREEIQTSAETKLFQDLTYHLQYVAYEAQMEALSWYADTYRREGAEEYAESLEEQINYYWQLQGQTESHFATEYIGDDLLYDQEARRRDLWVLDPRSRGVDPKGAFAEGQSLEDRSRKLMYIFLDLSVALFLYALAVLLAHKVKVILAAAATLLLVTGVILTILLQGGVLWS